MLARLREFPRPGAGDGFKSNVVYAVDGSRVAVVLFNGRRPIKTEFTRSAAAAADLYCAGWRSLPRLSMACASVRE
jgi:hypothetical protein